MQNASPDPMPQPATVSSYLALGDSYTIGEGVIENERWPELLVQALNKEGFSLKKPLIIATTGWTTADLKTAIAQRQPMGPFNLVSLLIGVNNQYQGIDMVIYEKEFNELLQTSIALAGSKPEHVFVVSIPDYAITPFAQQHDPERISLEIDQYNQVARSIAESYGVRFFNITPISRKAADNPALLAEDKLHPSGLMYQEWVDLVLPTVKKFLQN